MKIPKKISPCPLIDAIVEIRFSSKLPEEAIFGILYSKLQNDFPELEQLPILQIPPILRKERLELKYKPLYKISNDFFVVQIGADVITVSSPKTYKGWVEFHPQIQKIVTTILESGTIDKILRVSTRYINFFDEVYDIFNKIELSIKRKDKDIEYRNTTLQTQIELENDCIGTLQISNNVNFENATGSIIDIDVFSCNIDVDSTKILERISKCHENEINLFFSLLNDNFLNQFNPEY